MNDDFQLTSETFKTFPTTRYQGSKRKLLPWIGEHLSKLRFATALDVFGGTASVSYLLKKMGKAVVYNDAMRWNHLVGTALIQNNRFRLTEQEIEVLARPVKDEARGFVATHFKNIYFTERENLWIDSVVNRISDMSGKKSWNRYKTAIAYYALFQTCLSKRPFNLFHRRNLSLRFAQVERSFGNKTTWDKPFGTHFKHFIAEANRSVFEGSRPCSAINYKAENLPDLDAQLIYLDPPYLKQARSGNQSSDYSKCYHFLEGLADYHNWHAIINWQSRQLMPKTQEVNPWIKPGTILSAFTQLFDKYSDRIIVISYKKFGIPSIPQIANELRKRNKTVRIYSRPYKYALNHQNGSAELNRECLIIAE